MILSLYRASTTIGGPLIDAYLRRRLAAGREDAARMGERRGVASQPRPPGRLAWFHAASVGESLSVLPLITRLRHERPGLAILITTGTVTSARIMAARLPRGVLHQYVPVDRPSFVERFLDYWRPDLAFWVEQDLWPNLVRATAARGVPMVLLNARMSARSAASWRRLPRSVRALLEPFALVLAQSDAQADLFRRLGARDVVAAGNLKYGSSALPCDPDALGDVSAMLGERPRWLAASVHPGEEVAIIEAHRALAGDFPDLATLIVPRHPDRAGLFVDAARTAGLSTARRSADDPVMPATQVYVADTLGELGLFYRVAPVALVGGSLVRHGGQNPLEPARLGCAIVIGPHTESFDDLTEGLVGAGGAVRIESGEGLAEAVGRLLSDAAARRAATTAARRIADAEVAVLDRVLARLGPILDAATAHDHARA